MSEEKIHSLSLNWHSEGQKKAFNDKTRYVVIPAGRRYGKTQGALMRLGRNCLRSEMRALWVDTVQKNIDKYINEILLPFLEPVKELYHWNKQAKVITFKTGSVIHFGSAERPENLEGFAYNEIYLNEAGLILKGGRGEELWYNTLQPMAMDYKAQVLFIGTPKGLGLFRQFFDKGNDPDEPNWVTHHYTSYDNPYIDDAEIDAIVADMPPSVVQQEIYAQFMETDDGAPIIPYELAKEAFERINPADENYHAIWGVDPSQFGDDEAAICKRRWNTLLEPTITRDHLDSIQGAAWIQMEYESTPDEDKPREILIDAIGYGAGWYDQARKLGLPVRAVNVATKSSDPAKWFQTRDELWFKASKWLDTGSIAGDHALRREITLPLLDKEFLGKHGKFKIESKEKMKARLGKEGKSPNRADAFILTFAAGVERRSKFKKVLRGWRQQGNASWMAA